MDSFRGFPYIVTEANTISFAERLYYQSARRSLDRINTIKSKRMTRLNRSSVSLDDVWSTTACDHMEHEIARRLCPKKEQSPRPSIQQTNLHFDAEGSMSCKPGSSRVLSPRSQSLALPKASTDPSPPPRRWSATAGLFFSKKEACPTSHDWDLVEQATDAPAFRVVHF